MKNSRYFIWVIFLLMFFSAQAQKEYKYYEYSGFGIKVGANYSSISFQPAYTQVSGGMDWEAGLVYVFSDKKNVGIQVEALYFNRQWKETFESYSATTRLSYIQVPILTNINFGQGRMKYIIHLGAFYAIKIGVEKQINFPEDHQIYNDIKARQERSSDYGLLVGGGLRFISEVGIFQLDIRYAHSYQKLYNEKASGFEFSNLSGVQVGLIYILQHR